MSHTVAELNAMRALEEMGHHEHGIARALDRINDTLQKVADHLLQPHEMTWSPEEPPVVTPRTRKVVEMVISEELKELTDYQVGQVLAYINTIQTEEGEG